ncbi:MAG: class I mannose-6-phosphate isomerase, partial [Deltaproteobacteria bacterium]|nr:class I mannose-6-phosphate isomerase [Deltaproteobacteria bacterium]
MKRRNAHDATRYPAFGLQGKGDKETWLQLLVNLLAGARFFNLFLKEISMILATNAAQATILSMFPSGVIIFGNNFRPATATPWGGHEIQALKGIDHQDIIGEAWEVSADEKLPSPVVNSAQQTDLRRLVKAYPAELMGQRVAQKFHGDFPFLVKLLSADEKLSIQVHPDDKPEGWYIVSAVPGAGIYVGLEEGVTKQEFAEASRAGADVSRYLNFVEVRVGDSFHLEPGTIHAIGGGVTLYEPQKNGTT